MTRRVAFTQFGGPEVLEVVPWEPPEPGPREIRVRVKATGLNPVDHKILAGGPAAEAYGVTLPSGNGNDFSGIIDAVGSEVTEFVLGEPVLGGRRFYAQADFLLTEPDALIRKPAGLPFEEAGGLDIAGRTAWAGVAALGLTAEDIVLVSAAAGGVGVLACQLAIARGATVIGTAGADNHDFLRGLGVIPVAYGDGLADRVRDAANGQVTAVLDNHGKETIDAGFELGVPGDRINTIAVRGYRSEEGVTNIGGAAASIQDLAELAQLIADGRVTLPIDSVFPLERVTEAYERMLAGHLRGKIILITE